MLTKLSVVIVSQQVNVSAPLCYTLNLHNVMRQLYLKKKKLGKFLNILEYS